MSPSLGSERESVQDPLIRYAVEVGWKYVARDEALTLRRGEGGMLLGPVLREKLLALNPGVVTEAAADDVVSRIENARASIEGNHDVLRWLRGEHAMAVAGENRQLQVALVDFETPSRNAFHVTDEWEYTNGRHTNRADVMFLLNGVPVALVETKSAKKCDGIARALTQVRRYHDETPELLAAPQVFDVTHLLDFYYGPTWSLDHKSLFNWKDEEPGNFERKVKRFFARERFLRLLRDWIVFYTKDDETRKVILRQHQTRAVERIVERALDPDRRRGLIWHTQGSGKTLTMIKAAQAILGVPAFGAATVLMIVDRDELEGQLAGTLAAHGLSAEVADSKQRLRELLAQDRRGLIVSMIHKFDGADADLCVRDNVFVLVDEAHRSTGGDLGNFLVGALPRATMIGFTGTPIDRTAHGKGTFKVFGKDDERGYLDKYSIAESIEDGTTVRLHYQLAPNDLRVPVDLLQEQFLSLASTEGLSDIDELNEILSRAVKLRAFLKSPDRVARVIEFVVKHFRESVAPLGYKAFLVGVDREACALYKQELDRVWPAERSAVVYSPVHNDTGIVARYRVTSDDEKKIRKAFTKPGEEPNILIVTQKLLTGFDAPVLYCMYLDKPMRDHVLLQTIARVNRPYEVDDRQKPAGLVIDFVGIFARLEKALAFDPDVVGSAIQGLDVLRERFAALMATDAIPYLRLTEGPGDDKAVERALAAFHDREQRERFISFWKELQNLYEILSPDAFLRPYLTPYAHLGALYELVQNAYARESQSPALGDLAAKTEHLVRSTVTSGGVKYALPGVDLDAEALAALKADDASAPARVLSLGRGLRALVDQGGPTQPHLFSIAERADEILDRYDDRQLTTQTAIASLAALVEEHRRAKSDLERSGLPPRTFSIMRALDGLAVADAKELAAQIVGACDRHPEHARNPAQRRKLKADLYKLLLGKVGNDDMVKLVDQILIQARA